MRVLPPSSMRARIQALTVPYCALPILGNNKTAGSSPVRAIEGLFLELEALSLEYK